MKVLCAFLALPLAASQAQQLGPKSSPAEGPVDGIVLDSSKNTQPAGKTARPRADLGRQAAAKLEDRLTMVPGLKSLEDLDHIDFAEQELILRFKPELAVQQQDRFLADIEVEKVTFRSRLVPGLIAVRVRTTVRETLAKAGNRGDVLKYISPNRTVEARSSSTEDAIPVNDPMMDLLWGFDPERPGTNGVYPAWGYEIGSEQIIIGVVDNGLGMTLLSDGTEGVHPDLKANLWVNEDEIPWNGIDDDENGYIDDLNGFDFSAGTPDTTDTGNHGVHVGGTIAAAGNNGVGISGVMQRARLVSAQVFDGSGGSSDSLILQAMEYCTLAGCKVVNMSLGGYNTSGQPEPYYDEIIDRMLDLGVITVVAAGNDLSDVAYATPANSPLAVTVGGTGPNGSFYGSLNLGPGDGTNYGDAVDVCAPAYQVWSTLDAYRTHGVYSYYPLRGTSMATPYASGVLGLGFSAIHHGKTELGNLSPRAQAEALIDALIETGTDPDVGLPIGTLVDPAAFLRRIIRGCTADLNGDGQVGADDLTVLLSDWETNSSSSDIDGDGIVGPEDLAMLLGSWSFCNSSVCGDGICGPGESESCKVDCSEPEMAATCPSGMVEDCTEFVCVSASIIGDGYCDNWLANFSISSTLNLCCYEQEGGDCTEAQCLLLPCPDNEALDCNGYCVPDSLIANGYCDEPQTTGYDLNCQETNYDGNDCQPPGLEWCGDGICRTNESPWCPDCDGSGECPTGYVIDCSGSGECHPDHWVGDTFCDGAAQEYGADLCCYENDGGDCNNEECGICGDGLCSVLLGESPATCPEDCKSCPEGNIQEDDGTCTYSCAFHLTASGANCVEGDSTEYIFSFPGCTAISISYVNDQGDLVLFEDNWSGSLTWPNWPNGECQTFTLGFLNGEEASIEVCSECESYDYECGNGICDPGESIADCPEDCDGECPPGQVVDCDGSNECWDQSWVGDGYCDGTAQEYNADFCCYKNDGGDCTEEECE